MSRYLLEHPEFTTIFGFYRPYQPPFLTLATFAPESVWHNPISNTEQLMTVKIKEWYTDMKATQRLPRIPNQNGRFYKKNKPRIHETGFHGIEVIRPNRTTRSCLKRKLRPSDSWSFWGRQNFTATLRKILLAESGPRHKTPYTILCDLFAIHPGRSYLTILWDHYPVCVRVTPCC